MNANGGISRLYRRSLYDTELEFRTKLKYSIFKMYKGLEMLLYCNQCVVHHIKFCPVNLRFISCRAPGSLDTSSGGTAVLLGTVSAAGRENVLVFILRLNAFDLADAVWVLGLKDERITQVSFVVLVWKLNYTEMITITGQSFLAAKFVQHFFPFYVPFYVSSFFITLRSFSGCDRCLSLPAFLFSRVSFLILLFSKREYSSARYSVK